MTQSEMSTFAQLITTRNTVASVLGDCETTKAVSREVLRRMRAEWLPFVPKPHLFLTESYKNKIRKIYEPTIAGGCDNKIPAIKQVRTDWEALGNERLGLLEAKLYVEWICNCQQGYNPAFGDFMRKIGG